MERIENPASRIGTPQWKKTLPDFLTVREIATLSARYPDDPYELRDKAIFELLYSCGLRITEAVELCVNDLDFENRFITITGKGGKERMVPISEEAIRLIRKYLKHSRSEILSDRLSDYVFISKKGSRLNRKSLWRLLRGMWSVLR